MIAGGSQVMIILDNERRLFGKILTHTDESVLCILAVFPDFDEDTGEWTVAEGGEVYIPISRVVSVDIFSQGEGW